MRIRSWVVEQPGRPMVETERNESAGPGEVLVRVAGCGVCHTDLGFFYDGVPTRHAFPLTLGHEISGTVVEAGRGRRELDRPRRHRPRGDPVRRVRRVPGRARVDLPEAGLSGQRRPRRLRHSPARSRRGPLSGSRSRRPREQPRQVDLATLSVIADAVSTPYQAILAERPRRGRPRGLRRRRRRRRLRRPDRGGAGRARGRGRRERGAARRARGLRRPARPARRSARHQGAPRSAARLREAARRAELPAHKIFETSGTVPGQATAFGLLGPGGYLSHRRLHAQDRRAAPLEPHGLRRDRAGQLGLPARALPGGRRPRPRRARSRSRRSSSGARWPRSIETFADLHERKVSGRIVLIPER